MRLTIVETPKGIYGKTVALDWYELTSNEPELWVTIHGFDANVPSNIREQLSELKTSMVLVAPGHINKPALRCNRVPAACTYPIIALGGGLVDGFELEPLELSDDELDGVHFICYKGWQIATRGGIAYSKECSVTEVW